MPKTHFIFSLLIIAYSSFAYCDTSKLTRDFNTASQASGTGAVDSNNPITRSVKSIDNKVYFEASNEVSGASDIWVTDSTTKGTHKLALPHFDELHAFEVSKDKLIYIVRSKGNAGTSEIWEFDTINQESQLLFAVDSTSEIPELSHSRIIKLTETKLLIVAQNLDSKVAVYDSITREIEVINLDLSARTDENRYFVLNNEIYYNATPVVDGKFQPIHIMKTNLDTGIETVLKVGRIGSRHHIFDGKAYFVMVNAIWQTDGTIDGTKLVNEDYHRSKLLPNSLVIVTSTEFLIKKRGKSKFSKFEKPKEILFLDDIDEFIVELDESYYLIGRESTYVKSLYKTDFTSFFEKLIDSDSDFPFEEDWTNIKDFYVHNNKLMLLTAETRALLCCINSSYQLGSKIFSFNDTSNKFEIIWNSKEHQNLNFISYINNDIKELIFGYTVDTGIEPWYLSPSELSTFNLAEVNKKIINSDSKFSPSQGHVEYAKTVDRRYLDVTAYDGDSSYFLYLDTIEPVTIPDSQYNKAMTFAGVDVKNNYYFSYKEGGNLGHLHSFTFVEENNLTKNRVQNNNYKPGFTDVLLDNTFAFEGNLAFLTAPYTLMGFTGPSSINFLSAYGQEKIELDNIYTRLIRFKGKLLAYRANKDTKKAQFIVFKNQKLVDRFEVPLVCNESSSWACEFKTSVVNNILLVQDKQNRESLFYVIDSPNAIVKRVDSELFSSQYVIMHATENYFIISDGPKTPAHLIVSDTGASIPLNSGDFFPIGKYLVVKKSQGNIDIIDEKGVITNSFNVIHNTEYKNELWGNLTCHLGYCYLFGYITYDSYKAIKFDLNGDFIEMFDLDFSPQKMLWSIGNKMYLEGVNHFMSHLPQYGKELYEINIDLVDGDEDSIPDSVEISLGMDPFDKSDAQLDYDADGLNNQVEYAIGSNLFSLDTDFDGFTDDDEVRFGFDPTVYDLHLRDRDDDGLSEKDEIIIGTDPLNPDTDGDGVNDFNDSFPLNSDAQHDTDGDTMPDGWELKFGLDPLDPNDAYLDLNGNGVINIDEYENQADPSLQPTLLELEDSSKSEGGTVNLSLLFLLIIILLGSHRLKYTH